MSWLKKISLVGLCLVVLGCTGLSVKHLNKAPFSPNQTQSLSMRYLTFKYTPYYSLQGYTVKGKTFFKEDKIPGWATYIQELWLAIYLSDAKGKVLAKQIKVYLPQKLTPAGIPFEFSLTPKEIPTQRPLFLTFGYSFKLSPQADYKPPLKSDPLTGDKELIFYASQGALVY